MRALLELNGVSKRFSRRVTLGERVAGMLGSPVETREVRAVENVTLSIAKGETLGLVGKSGCGKSTLGRVAAGIYTPSEGEARLDGAAIMSTGAHARKLTTRIQTVFQDPFASLDPRMRVGDTLAEGPLAHGLVKSANARQYVAQWLARVGLDPDFADRYPHQFSGGQRQRIAIARALAMQPDLLICDEPVASLDVSIQAQILNLFLKLRRELNLTCLFISHDLGVVRHVSDRVAIMYLGRIVELGATQDVYAHPNHPYTKALLEFRTQARPRRRPSCQLPADPWRAAFAAGPATGLPFSSALSAYLRSLPRRAPRLARGCTRTPLRLPPQRRAKIMTITLAIHGGCGILPRAQMTKELDRDFRAALRASLDAGWRLLKNGGSALDAVEAAVVVMEEFAAVQRRSWRRLQRGRGP